uniref:Uncharacterized protein n=1 Tax=viral metagenome TaxID=1070528 RepID=A0A6M3K9E0_9ZZZZ
MTDRLNTLTVVLEKPVREDDAVTLMDAIGTMRGVLRVERGELDAFAGQRVQRDHAWQNALIHLIQSGPESTP